MTRVASIGANRPLIGSSDLASFLFGSERGSLDGFRTVLRDHQADRIDADRFVRLDGSWRDALGTGGLRRVAEPPPPEYQ